MSDIVIRVENLSKRYTLSHQQAGGRSNYKRFSDVLLSAAKAPFHHLRALRDRVQKLKVNGVTPDLSPRSSIRAAREDFWALKDVSFEVKRGEVVGIIGRNGAGKSTLLKILSRITEPTSGRIEIDGRVASLLEVGTGFHPELTGRENIYLNGAILGMTRAEIKRKFDEIVAFAETEKFLDTPVKHYSSGMYVRLAFAVAAYLEPEILIVDEVLAVGDIEFQKKCLGKMQDVAKEDGRTVLFVSHNFDSLLRLCTKAFLLDAGQVCGVGGVKHVIELYHKNAHIRQGATINLTNAVRVAGLRNQLRFIDISCPFIENNRPWLYEFMAPISFNCTIQAFSLRKQCQIAFAVFTANGFEIASTRSAPLKMDATTAPAKYHISVRIPHLRLAPGSYSINLGLRSEFGDEDFIPRGSSFEVATNDSAAAILADTIRAVIIPESEISLENITLP